MANLSAQFFFAADGVNEDNLMTYTLTLIYLPSPWTMVNRPADMIPTHVFFDPFLVKEDHIIIIGMSTSVMSTRKKGTKSSNVDLGAYNRNENFSPGMPNLDFLRYTQLVYSKEEALMKGPIRALN